MWCSPLDLSPRPAAAAAAASVAGINGSVKLHDQKWQTKRKSHRTGRKAVVFTAPLYSVRHIPVLHFSSPHCCSHVERASVSKAERSCAHRTCNLKPTDAVALHRRLSVSWQFMAAVMLHSLASRQLDQKNATRSNYTYWRPDKNCNSGPKSVIHINMHI